MVDQEPLSTSPVLVAGESADVLFEAFQRMEFATGPDGTMAVDSRLVSSLGAPLVRALQRVEAELAEADEALVEYDGAGPRTHEQRLADSFVELALAVSAAVFNQAA